MKKIVTLLFIIMLGMTTCFSQTIPNDTTVFITAKQLKTTNLIFLEHQNLLIEDSLLRKELNYRQLENNILIKTDSIRQKQIQNIHNSYNKDIESLKKQVKVWKIGGISISSGLLLWLLLK